MPLSRDNDSKYVAKLMDFTFDRAEMIAGCITGKPSRNPAYEQKSVVALDSKKLDFVKGKKYRILK
jgi:hypothetical protein